jgi:hypothetical protein
MSGRYWRRKPRRNIRWRSRKKADSSDICDTTIHMRSKPLLYRVTSQLGC